MTKKTTGSLHNNPTPQKQATAKDIRIVLPL
jgi:hypothetical protein